MAKNKVTKSNEKVGNTERESFIGLIVETTMKQGTKLGDDIIERMDLTDIDPVVMGTAAIGLAKAVAMLKDVGRRTGINIDKLYQKELAYFKREFAKIKLDVDLQN